MQRGERQIASVAITAERMRQIDYLAAAVGGSRSKVLLALLEDSLARRLGDLLPTDKEALEVWDALPGR
jgi:hypothetical protein